MSNSRSISITVKNGTSYTWTSYVGQASAGGTPTPRGYGSLSDSGYVAINVHPGTQLVVSASNSNGDCNGTFTVSDSSHQVSFPVTYVHPSDNSATTVAVVPASGYPACMSVPEQEPPITGQNPSVTLDLYVGEAVYQYLNGPYNPATTVGYVAPVSSTPYSDDNARDVINSLFNHDIRTPNVVSVMLNQANAVPYQPADYSGGQLSLLAPNASHTPLGSANPKGQLTQAILNLWPGVAHVGDDPGPDYPFVEFLANFLVPNPASRYTPPLVMWVPCFSFDGNAVSGDTAGPKYKLSGYQAFPLGGTDGARFNMDNVTQFVQLLMGGAHFVNIQAERDISQFSPANLGRDLYGQFLDAFADDGTATGRHRCDGNSHYVATGPTGWAHGLNTSGWYYGNQMGEWADSNCGLLLSLLIAKTADHQYNTFMQLEGWPADNDWLPGQSGSPGGGDRHGGDYDAYSQSLWNISTFGATPYSEKRATTIFLAPSRWTPTINSSTFMMPYVGAETPQNWLHTDFVSLA
jgi:hypothetical protein